MSRDTPRIVYFVPEWPTLSSGVLHSTVLAEAGFLQNHGFECLYVGSEASPEKAEEARRLVEQTYGISAFVCGCHSTRFRMASILWLTRKLARLAMPTIERFRPTHVWTDTFQGSFLVRRWAHRLGAVCVWDVQAIVCEEVALRRGKGLRYGLMRWAEGCELRRADRLGGVSRAMRAYVRNWVGRDDLVVVPCCCDVDGCRFSEEARRRWRGEFGFAEAHRVLCYCGGLADWQRAPDILSLCNEVAKRREDCRFLFLCQATDSLRRLMESAGLPRERCVVKSCLPQEVPDHLSAADAGIIMRDDIPVNNVASPIKIGEYLSCGLPVILTRGIGDYSQMLHENGLGLLLDETRDVGAQVVGFMERPDFADLRYRAIEFAKGYASWESHLTDLKELFRPKDRK